METTVRILRVGDPDENCSRVFVVDQTHIGAKGETVTTYRVCNEWMRKVPITVNRHVLQNEIGPCAIEWSGDVSCGGQYVIDAPDVIPALLQLMCIYNPLRNWTRVRSYPASFWRRAREKYFDGCRAVDNNILTRYDPPGQYGSFEVYRGTRDVTIWQICCIHGILVTRNNCQVVDMKRFNDLMSDLTNSQPIPPLIKDISGWRIEGVTALHDVMFGAQLATPHIGLSFTTIADDASISSCETMTNESTVVDTSSTNIERIVSRDTRQRHRIEELEAREGVLVRYIEDLANRLNPRLPERMRIKSVRDVIAGR